VSTVELCLVANTRLPSQRAQGLQVVHQAAAFARAGRHTLLVHALRHGGRRASAAEVLQHYGVAAQALPLALEAVQSVDWIERVPPALQYLPARVQEQSFARNAARWLRAHEPQALMLARDVECARALVRGGARVALEVHRVPGGRLRRRWLVEAARGALGVIAISGGVAADLAALGIEGAVVEHDAYDAARFARLPERATARRELGLEPTAPLVVYTGGLLAWKGVEVLVDAARLLPRVQFLIAGGMDQDVARLRQRAQDLPNVRIDGFQPPERIPLYLAAADTGVVPNRSAPAISARYTSPLKVFEAFAAGLPLVASDLPSLRELCTDGLDAVLVAPDDPAALARGIERLLGDEGLRARLRARLFERARGATFDARAARILAHLAAWSART
jgi:glycosyltransferase involved in cell wall biosynthesis